MTENGYTEYNTPAALQRGQMIDIYLFVLFLFLPFYDLCRPAHTQKFATTDKYLFPVVIQISLFVVGEADPQYVK